MDDASCPYKVGSNLQLFDTDRQEHVLVTIVAVFLPLTWSAVMKVTLPQNSGNERLAVLKLYDRRYCPGLREDSDMPPWTDDNEHDYLESMHNGSAYKFITWLERTTETQVDDSKWNIAENEVWVQSRCRDMWKNETAVYNALTDIQGSCVPRLYHKVTMDPLDPPSVSTDVFKIPGIIIEFIDGFGLDKLHHNTPQSQWQNLCDQAIKVVHWISNHGVLNEDVRCGNMIVRRKIEKHSKSERVEDVLEPVSKDSYDVFAIDFGLSRLRLQDETDDEWKKAKYKEHEDEEIGIPLKNELRNFCGFELTFRYTRRYDGPWFLERLWRESTYEEFVLMVENEDSVELKTSVRKLFEDARHWPAHLRDRIFINPSRYIMHGDKHGIQMDL